MSLEEKIHQVEAFYSSLDIDLTKFQKDSTLSCLSGCSNCCTSPTIEATILEMLPLAFYLYKENKAAALYDALQETTIPICTLYKPMHSVLNKGACSSYPYRALTCRLFGFSFARNKYSAPVLVACKDIKNEHALVFEKLEADALSGLAVPMISTYKAQLSAIDYYLSLEHYSINKAISLAIEMVMNHFNYKEEILSHEKKVS